MGIRWGWVGILALVSASCGQPATLRQDEVSQDDAATQEKYAELAPAEGIFQGSITLTGSGESFDSTVVIKRTMQTERNPQSDDPSDTVSLPTLTGCLRFPALENLPLNDWPGFHELLGPLGENITVTFDLGDYDPSTLQLVLPYTVSGYSGGTYGELSGALQNGKYHADWFSKPYGDAGTFDLTLQPGAKDECVTD